VKEKTEVMFVHTEKTYILYFKKSMSKLKAVSKEFLA